MEEVVDVFLDVALERDKRFTLSGEVIQHDMKAVFGQSLGDTFANSSRGTCDERDTSIQCHKTLIVAQSRRPKGRTFSKAE